MPYYKNVGLKVSRYKGVEVKPGEIKYFPGYVFDDFLIRVEPVEDHEKINTVDEKSTKDSTVKRRRKSNSQVSDKDNNIDNNTVSTDEKSSDASTTKVENDEKNVELEEKSQDTKEEKEVSPE